jgi:hypothetical protein
MKLLNHLMVGSLVLTLSMSLFISTASAETSKKKKKAATPAQAEKKVEKKKSAPVKKVISGTNLEGRSGLFYADTSAVAPKNEGEGAIHATWTSPYSGANNFVIPVGGHLGMGDRFEISGTARLMLQTAPSYTTTEYLPPLYLPQQVTLGGGSSTNFMINAGAKYAIPGENRETPDFSVGGQLYIPTYTGGQVVVMPYGTCTYVLPAGLLLNGQLGIAISSTTYVVLDGGVAYPISPKISLIGELGANNWAFLYRDSELALGARFAASENMKVQALLGVPLNGGGVLLGAGLIL